MGKDKRLHNLVRKR